MLVPPFLFNFASWSDWKELATDHGWRLALVVVTVIAIRMIFARVVGRALRTALARASRLGREDPEAIRARADTLMSTVNWAFGTFILLIGITLVLDELGVSVTALVAGVGLVGLALGLGAQALIKDVINGMFILIEDQYRVGDVVRVAGISGAVLEITPRRTLLRDLDGHVHSIPNGEIGVATNMTRGFSRINLDVTVAYEEELERVIRVLDGVCEELARDHPEDIISKPAVLRVDQLGDDGVTLKLLGEVQPGRQWDLMGELRRRIKDTFDEEAVEIPYRREVHIPWEVIESRRSDAAGDAEKG